MPSDEALLSSYKTFPCCLKKVFLASPDVLQSSLFFCVVNVCGICDVKTGCEVSFIGIERLAESSDRKLVLK